MAVCFDAMRTTIRLRDDLLKRAKKRAAEESRTLTSLVEQLVSAVHEETLHERRPEMQRVLDAEKAFER